MHYKIRVMQDKDLLTAWKSQLRKGAAELAVLSLLGHRESYGLEILNALSRGSSFEVSEGSIYPLLKRLETSGKIRSRWVEAEDGMLDERRLRIGVSDGRRTEVVAGELEEGEAVVTRARMSEG